MLRSIVLAASAVVFSLSALAQTAASAPAATAAKPAVVKAAAAAPAGDVSEGKVAYYGTRFAGRKTASGQKFNPAAMTMAHKTLPFGTKVRVTNLKNNKSVVVRVNDRGPTAGDRVGDLSLAAAKKIRMVRAGVVDAKLEVLGK
jgi:rare lipoprotein A